MQKCGWEKHNKLQDNLKNFYNKYCQKSERVCGMEFVRISEKLEMNQL